MKSTMIKMVIGILQLNVTVYKEKYYKQKNKIIYKG